MTRQDYSLSPMRVNIITLLTALPLFAVLLFIYMSIWSDVALAYGFVTLAQYPLIFLLILISGVIVHELLHGLTWQWLSNEHNSVTYGIRWKTLTPYTYITHPISIGAYAIGLVMPGLILGILPTVMALIDGSGTLLLLGMIFTLASVSDAVILWRLRNVDASATVEDHPTRAGVYVYETVPQHDNTNQDTLWNS